MATLTLQNTSSSAIDGAFAALFAGPPLTQGFLPNPYFVSYTFGSLSVNVNGDGTLSFNDRGRLVGGTVTGLQEYGTGPDSFTLSGLQLPFAAFAASNMASGAAAALLSGNDTVTLSNNTGVPFDAGAGNDTIIVAPGAATAAVDGGSGSNNVVFGSLRSDATVTSQRGGGNIRVGGFNVSASGNAYASPVSVSATNTSQLSFIDGNVYSDTASFGGQVAVLYTALLGRSADAGGLGAFASAAAKYGLTAVANGVLGTAEGQADTGGLSNDAFVNQLYQNTLGRAADTAGKTFWLNALNDGTADRGKVAASFAISTEAATQARTTLGTSPLFGATPEAVAADRVYQTLTNGLPSAALLASATQTLLNGGTTAQLADQLIGAPSYAAQFGQPDAAAFVTGLQVNVYGSANAAATNFWASGIASGAVSRGQVVDAYAATDAAVAKANLLVTQGGVAHG